MSFHQDLDNLTRDMHDKTWLVEYMHKNPITAMMLANGKNMSFKGGAKYTRKADTDTHEDLVQDYNVNDTLTHGVKDTTEEVSFRRKKMQCPVQIDVDEELENARQTKDGTQLHNMAKFRVRKANEAMRVHMRKKFYMSVVRASGVASSDTNKYVQGLNSALEVDQTYGGVTRTYSAGTKADAGFWFQPMGGVIAAGVQQSAKTISINWLRDVQEPLEDLESDNTDLIIIIGGILWLSLQAEAEARNMPYKLIGARTAKQGFTEMVLDDHRILKDPFLKAANNTIMGETTSSYGDLAMRLYSINLKDWEMFIHPTRNFKMQNFFDQSQLMGGTDSKLARIKFSGNLTCWNPTANMYYSLVSP